jgi:hypothetical protein
VITPLVSLAVTSSLTAQQKHVASGWDRQGRWFHLYLSAQNAVNFPAGVHGWTLWAIAGVDSVVVP